MNFWDGKVRLALDELGANNVTEGFMECRAAFHDGGLYD